MRFFYLQMIPDKYSKLVKVTIGSNKILIQKNYHSGVFPGSTVVRNLCVNAGDAGLIPEQGSSLGRGNGNPLQYFCLENPMD